MSPREQAAADFAEALAVEVEEMDEFSARAAERNLIAAALRVAEADVAWSGKAWRTHGASANRSGKRRALHAARIAYREARDALAVRKS